MYQNPFQLFNQTKTKESKSAPNETKFGKTDEFGKCPKVPKTGVNAPFDYNSESEMSGNRWGIRS